ncbi:MAG: VOC family protein [Nitrososphaerota archaeon]|nr:VOC family protein [Nitrososphaerota archaeon]
MKGQVYHIEINVSNFEISSKFYEALLAWLGYREIASHKTWAGWGNGSCSVWVTRSFGEHVRHGYHRRRVGLNHIAFHADSRKMVDEFHDKFLRPKGSSVLYGGPRERPEYSKGYYPVYFEDPDRIKLELVYTPPSET